MQDVTHQTKMPPSEPDALYFRISNIDTSPLTESTTSKKHVRILVALFAIRDTSENDNLYVRLDDLQDLVTRITYKRYPYLDIISFTYDLSTRGYTKIHKCDNDEDCYAITELGVSFLEQLACNPGTHLEGSKSPNFYPVVH